MHDLLEDDGVDVLAEHVEEEPVAHLTLLDDGVDHLTLDQPEPDVEQVGSHPWTQDDNSTIDNDKRR